MASMWRREQRRKIIVVCSEIGYKTLSEGKYRSLEFASSSGFLDSQLEEASNRLRNCPDSSVSSD